MKPGEDHLSAAKRESKEELGLVGGKWTYLGYIREISGVISMKQHLYLVTGNFAFEENKNSNENIRRVCMPFDEAIEKSIKGEISGAPTIASIFRADRYLREHPDILK